MKKLLSLGCSLLFYMGIMVAPLHAQCLQGDCWDGMGAYLYPSGAKYEGQFQDGKIHGTGVLFFSNGNKYVGEWNKFYREGQGEMHFTDGGAYKGEFKASRFHGKGVFKYPNGDHYDGHWKNDLAEGQGVYSFQDGDRYEGAFVQGKFDGQGTMYYKDGAKYSGSWKANKKNGQGTYVNAQGKAHEGVWQNGARVEQPIVETQVASAEGIAAPSGKLRDCNTAFCENGQGAFKYGDGSRYVGQFLNGEPEGQGTIFYKNGDKYVGGWKNHAPDGEGIMYYQNGRVVGAVWKNGEVEGIVHNKHELQIGEEYVEQDKSKEVKIWAVLVGVAQYKHMPVLKYTDDDAYRLYAFLKSPEGGALPDEQIRILIDEDASRANILRAMKQVFYQADANDVIVFYFSGHGYDGSFIPSDYDGYNNLLFHREVKGILEKSVARHKICYADACHSGSAGEDKDDLLAMRSGTAQPSIEKYYKAFEDSKGGIALLLSSKGDEYSLEDEGLRQGIFSHYLMRGLKGEADVNKNAIVTIDEIYRYVRKEVRAYTTNAQTPILSGEYDIQMPVALVR